MTRRVFVFLGPSLPVAERSVWKDTVTILPPVAAGDLQRLPARPGDVVGIVDGYFRGRAPVRHKEILDLLNRGVHVHGAASMGALRAAELAAFGMVGHGSIFRGYHEGILVADDEVALVHGTAEEGYEPYTVALANVRHALARAVADGGLSLRTAEEVIAAGRRLPFTERTREALLAAAGLDAPTTCAVQRALACGEDLKRRDALELLQAVTAGQGAAPQGDWRLEETSYLRSWRAWNAGYDHPVAGFVSDVQVHEFCRVEALDYPAFHERVALEALLNGTAPLPASARAATLTGDRSPQPVQGDRGRAGCESTTIHHAVVSALQTSGLLGDPARELGWLRWCTRAEAGLPLESRLAKAAARALFPSQALAIANPFVEALKKGSRIEAARKALIHVLLFNQSFAEQHPGLHLDRLRSTRIRQWYAARWGCGDDLEGAVLQRSYPTIAHFTSAARPFYLHAARCRDCPPFTINR